MLSNGSFQFFESMDHPLAMTFRIYTEYLFSKSLDALIDWRKSQGDHRLCATLPYLFCLSLGLSEPGLDLKLAVDEIMQTDETLQTWAIKVLSSPYLPISFGPKASTDKRQYESL